MSSSWKKQRRVMMPSQSEQFEALWDFVEAQKKIGVELPPKTEAVLSQINAAKQKVKKPI